MGLEVFDWLLRDERIAFGDKAWPEWSFVADPLKGRFAIDPFTQALSPSENGLSSTVIMFYYDERHDLPNGVRPARMGDFLTIRNVRYEVIDIQRDDLGEAGLQLTTASQVRPPVVWDNGATDWSEDEENEQPVSWVI
jgi:hypothetical protein